MSTARAPNVVPTETVRPQAEASEVGATVDFSTVAPNSDASACGRAVFVGPIFGPRRDIVQAKSELFGSDRPWVGFGRGRKSLYVVNAWTGSGVPVLERERHRAAPDIVFTPLGMVSASRAG